MVWARAWAKQAKKILSIREEGGENPFSLLTKRRGYKEVLK
jgi:hypothetical protein